MFKKFNFTGKRKVIWKGNERDIIANLGAHPNDENELILNKENNINNNDHANFSGTNNAQASIKREDPKIGRNELVKISNGKETKEIKYKKAQALINSGEWKVL